MDDRIKEKLEKAKRLEILIKKYFEKNRPNDEE